MRNAVLALGLMLAISGEVLGQSGAWADKLFAAMGELSHDFGTVPRGAQLKYRFMWKNIYKVPLGITEVRATCGCVTFSQTGNVLQPNEEGWLDIVMDARLFSGHKSVPIHVTVGPQFVSTATLRVSANARPDVVFNPGTVNFGIVQHGQTPLQVLDVEYSGFLNWQIQEVVKNASAPFQVAVEEMYRISPRPRKPGLVGYRFKVTLKADAAAGPFKQDLILKTNDPASPTLTVSVEGAVQASLAVAPSVLQMGSVKVGESQTRKVIVKGSRPFRIVGVDGQENGLKVEVPDRAAESHLLVVRYQPSQVGALKSQLLIRTDLEQESVAVTVQGNVTK